MALTPLSGTFDLTALPPDGIDPREWMIEKLAEQNQALLTAMDKAQNVFEKTQSHQKEAIDNLSNTNDDLRQALKECQARNKKMKAAYAAQNQALQEKLELIQSTLANVTKDLKKSMTHCDTITASQEQVAYFVEANILTSVFKIAATTDYDEVGSAYDRHGWGTDPSTNLSRLTEKLDSSFRKQLEDDIVFATEKIAQEAITAVEAIKNKLSSLLNTVKKLT